MMISEDRRAAETDLLRDRLVTFTYYGRRYGGQIVRTTGRGAIVRFSVKTDHPRFGRERERRIDPVDHDVRLDPVGRDAASTFVVGRSWQELLDDARSAAGWTPSFLGDSFAEQALANTYDACAERDARLDRSYRGRAGMDQHTRTDEEAVRRIYARRVERARERAGGGGR